MSEKSVLEEKIDGLIKTVNEKFSVLFKEIDGLKDDLKKDHDKIIGLEKDLENTEKNFDKHTKKEEEQGKALSTKLERFNGMYWKVFGVAVGGGTVVATFLFLVAEVIKIIVK